MYARAASLPNLYIRNIIPDDMGIPSLAVLALSGWGYTDFHASANFAFWGFSEVRILGFLRSSHPEIAPGHTKIAHMGDATSTSWLLP